MKNKQEFSRLDSGEEFYNWELVILQNFIKCRFHQYYHSNFGYNITSPLVNNVRRYFSLEFAVIDLFNAIGPRFTPDKTKICDNNNTLPTLHSTFTVGIFRLQTFQDI